MHSKNLSNFVDMSLDSLPLDCFSHVLSFSSPRDACRVSVASAILRSAADSDTVWGNFLPEDYEEILSRSVSPVTYTSKKDLFLRLCNNPLPIDDGKKMFYIDKLTGKKRYILGARELSIRWANNPLYWSWKPLLNSRFEEVAELRTIWWLEVEGKIRTKMLSPKTSYGAYLVVKFADHAYGFDSFPLEVSVQDANFRSSQSKLGYLRGQEGKRKCPKNMSFSPKKDGGWVEIELGSFYNHGGDDGFVRMSLKEVKSEHLKGGLIIEGLELRPKL